MASALRFGPLGPRAVHLCVDMQTLFAERTDWHVPWLERVLPAVIRLAEARRGQTVFTRFVPPERPEEAAGAWRRYYEHWRNMTGDRINPRLIELVPPLAALAPPPRVPQQRRSAWGVSALAVTERLVRRDWSNLTQWSRRKSCVRRVAVSVTGRTLASQRATETRSAQPPIGVRSILPC